MFCLLAVNSKKYTAVYKTQMYEKKHYEIEVLIGL